jgi:hypothetical protein
LAAALFSLSRDLTNASGPAELSPVRVVPVNAGGSGGGAKVGFHCRQIRRRRGASSNSRRQSPPAQIVETLFYLLNM